MESSLMMNVVKRLPLMLRLSLIGCHLHKELIVHIQRSSRVKVWRLRRNEVQLFIPRVSLHLFSVLGKDDPIQIPKSKIFNLIQRNCKRNTFVQSRVTGPKRAARWNSYSCLESIKKDDSFLWCQWRLKRRQNQKIRLIYIGELRLHQHHQRLDHHPSYLRIY